MATTMTFLGPGTHWTYAPGETVEAGEAVSLTDEQIKSAAAAGINLTTASPEEVADAQKPADPQDAGTEAQGNPVNPGDGTASVNATAPPPAAEDDAASKTAKKASTK